MSCLILSAAGATYWYNARGSDFNYGVAIDTSASMTADDYTPNRLEAAKEAASEFVDSTGVGTNIGVITFTGTTFLKQRLNSDVSSTKKTIQDIQIETVGGTAIGDALVTGSNLFFSGNQDKDNVLVLLTDGQNNVGLEPNEAIPFLLDNKVLVYTIGVGTIEGGNFIGDVGVSRLDEETLKFIASETGGQYFHAEDNNQIRQAFSNIAQLKLKRISKDLTLIFLITSVVLLLIEWGLMNTKFKSLP